jgi:hypothetical protein
MELQYVFINKKTAELFVYESPFLSSVYARMQMGSDFDFLGEL